MREAIIEICRRLYQRNMLAAADGNVSVRQDDGTILITPAGVAKAFMKPEQMATLDKEGRPIHGSPSTETAMHLAVYRAVPQAQAVVHAHPPTAIAWTIAQTSWTELPVNCMSELLLAVGRVPIVPYCVPGTEDMGRALASYLPECRVMLLARHGAIAWGESLEEAHWGIERAEHAATILAHAATLGGIHPLQPSDVARLRQLRKKIGPRTL